MARKYGLPYKGSKNAIADWIIEHLPASGVLVDLFCGGCAVTHAALLAGKWDRIIVNDIHGDVPQLFLDAIAGKYTTDTEKRWISREDFFRLKETDAYVRLCWSFGNDGNTYMYAKEIESDKKSIHELIFAGTVAARMGAWKNLQKLEKREAWNRLQHLERLTRLESLTDLRGNGCIQASGRDFRNVEIPADSVIYCDIPYDCTTDNYGVQFDRAAFLDWANEQTAPIVISEYCIEDERFAVLAETEKRQLIQGAKRQKKVLERLYCPKRQLDEIRARLNAQEKMAI